MIYPTIRHLRAFESVSRLGSFAHAADELCISPSALSQNISQLEDILSTRLIDRTTRHMQLTMIGEQLYPRIQRWLQEMETTFQEVSSQGQLSKGRVKIASLASIAINILPSAILGFKEKYPDIQVAIRDGTGSSVEHLVLDHDADFGIAGGPVRSPELSFEPLFNEEYCLLCPRGHPLASSSKPVCWKDLFEYNYISLSSETNIGQQLRSSSTISDLIPTPVHEVSQLGTLWGLVEKQFGVSALPRSACPVNSAIVCVPLVKPELKREVGILTVRGRSLSPAAEVFRSTLIESIAPD